MISLRLLVPEATTNYVLNPSFRYNVDGWTTTGGTVTMTRTLDYARFNIASMKVVTPGNAVHEGVYYLSPPTSGATSVGIQIAPGEGGGVYQIATRLASIEDSVTASVYLRGEGQVRLCLVEPTSGILWIKDKLTLYPDRWTRFEVSGRSDGVGSSMRMYIETDGAARAATFYVDGAQIERKTYSSTFCDGDQPGCKWNIVSHASRSSRLASTREGGRWVALVGPCKPDNNLYVTVMGGFGMPPLANHTQPWANEPGSFFQDSKILDRVVTLNFFVKKEAFRTGSTPPSLRYLHELRQQLIDILKPDKTNGSEAFLFEYSDTESDKPLYIRMRYEAGLEGEWDVRNRWYNSFPIRMVAVDPFFTEDTQDVKQLGVKTSYNSDTAQDIWVRKNGGWFPLLTSAGVTVQNTVRCMVEPPSGLLYIGGNFNNDGLNYVAEWDGVTLHTLGIRGGANGVVNGITVAPTGQVFVTGAFTNIGGVACSYVARYNPTTDMWAAMGAGLNGIGRGICAASNGEIYVVGEFTSAGGVACRYIARWDGSSWHNVGTTGGFNTDAYCVVKSDDGNSLYVGGLFTTSFGGGVTYNRVAKVDTTTNLISQLGYGVNGAVNALAVGLDGTLYAGGIFTLSGQPGSTEPLLYVSKYSGGLVWQPLGSGFDNTVHALSIGKNGELYAGGAMTLSGTKEIPHLGKWLGDTWTSQELYNMGSGNPSIYSILTHSNGELFVGQQSSTAPYFTEVPYLNTVTNNGTASCWPIMYIQGQGTVRYIANINAGKEIQLNLPIFEGEDVFIDFARGKITSTTRGDLSRTILPGSEIRSMYLLPGDNTIAILITDEVTPTCQLRWVLQDWSADSIVDSEAL